ncbi:Gfo/Idh/MocA family oxidoreductase [Flavivirga aquimarina]|uniref:Gfo/Idh/MocA family oxidoreductase n=1 Tax=Flavivirga aquimarina TaxID=2027862 RepID=A0ABT8WBS4_9FLAO|nr:Gfo/Idh/MocA family oxidoreductase [Flavivirga aquimarina]MDO5970481.1 Gfo/Idh/MocA family oxidoreductase [Flavivirga aquimarina]
MEAIIKTGVLSFGKSGELFHAPFLEAHSAFQFTAVVERTKKKAHLKYPNVKSYDSVDALLEDDDIELIVINTPNATHYEFALKALQTNKHILVEKPFTVTSIEAKTLFAEAKKYNRLILPYQNRRYDSDYLSVKNIVDSGKLGKLIEAHFRYDRYILELSPNKLRESAIPGNGISYNLGPHVLDAAISLFGMPLKWSKKIGYFRPNTQIDDYAQFHLEYPEGLQVFITLSLLVANPQPAFIIHGTKGSYVKQRTDIQEEQLMKGMNPNDSFFGIEKPNKEGVLTVVSPDGEKTHEKIVAIKSSYMNLFDDVYQAIKNGKDYPITENEIIKQIEILEES